MKEFIRKIAPLVISLISVSGYSQHMRTYGIKINVTDLEIAVNFYCNKVGFKIKSRNAEYVHLISNDENILILNQVPQFLPERPQDTKAGLTLQVNDLDQAIARLRSNGVDFGDEQKRKEAVGYSIYAKDPFGKAISFMHQTIVNTPEFTEPRIYNYGFAVPDMTKAIEFYSGILGFSQRSQKYLPYDMPLGHLDGSFGFMLHYRDGIEPIKHRSPDSQHVVIIFKTSDLDSAIAMLKKNGVIFLQQKPQLGSLGRYMSFVDPFGYISEVIETENEKE